MSTTPEVPPKCSKMVKAMRADDWILAPHYMFKMVNALSMYKGGDVMHLVKAGPFAGVSFLSKATYNGG